MAKNTPAECYGSVTVTSNPHTPITTILRSTEEAVRGYYYGPGPRSSHPFRVYGRTVNETCGPLAASGFLRSSLFAPSLHS